MDDQGDQSGCARELDGSRTENASVTTSRAIAPRVTELYYSVLVAIVDSTTVACSAYFAFIVYHGVAYSKLVNAPQYFQAALCLALIFSFVCLVDEQYELFGTRWSCNCISRGIGSIFLSFSFFLTLIFVSSLTHDYSRGTFLTQLAFVVPSVFVTRLLLSAAIKEARATGKLRGSGIVVLLLSRRIKLDELCRQYGWRIEDVSGLFELDFVTEGDEQRNWEDNLRLRLHALCSHCRLYSAGSVIVVFDATSMRCVAGVVAVLSELPVRIQLLPVCISPFMQRSRIVHCGGTRVLEFHSRPSSLLDRLAKRTFDLTVALIGVVLLCPLFAIIALAIKLDTRGPVFFVQTRNGFNEEPIRVIKFRSMTTLEDGPDFRQASRGDPRITRVGQFLRCTNLDELPQLFNVIIGNMSIVGPRPHAIAHNHMFRNQIKILARRHNVRPGITGWAQVNGYRGETDTCEKMRKRVEFDLEYIDNWSLYFDIKIVVLTVFAKRAYLNAA